MPWTDTRSCAGDARAAIPHFQRARGRIPYIDGWLQLANHVVRVWHGRTLLELDHLLEAARYFESPRWHPLAIAEAARAYELAGETTAALRTWARLQHMWRDAEPEFGEARDVQGRLERGAPDR